MCSLITAAKAISDSYTSMCGKQPSRNRLEDYDCMQTQPMKRRMQL